MNQMLARYPNHPLQRRVESAETALKELQKALECFDVMFATQQIKSMRRIVDLALKYRGREH